MHCQHHKIGGHSIIEWLQVAGHQLLAYLLLAWFSAVLCTVNLIVTQLSMMACICNKPTWLWNRTPARRDGQQPAKLVVLLHPLSRTTHLIKVFQIKVAAEDSRCGKPAGRLSLRCCPSGTHSVVGLQQACSRTPKPAELDTAM
jgi:hypothetical protein